MLEILSRQIPYSSSLKKQFLIATLLGILVSFIMVFLQPFDTYRFESNHKNMIMIGFGILLSTVYMINTRLDSLWYHYKAKNWNIKYEIFWFLSLVFISSVIIHFYNQVFLNDLFAREFDLLEYVKHGIWFFQHSIIPIVLIITPFYVYLRNRFGEINTSESSSEIEFFGINKGEKITIQKHDVLFVRASENYVEIYYTNNQSILHETFRNTLTAIKTQAPFLHQCHRSYLINASAIKTINGNSQNAKIKLNHYDLDIPLSKSYYKTLKMALNIKP